MKAFSYNLRYVNSMYFCVCVVLTSIYCSSSYVFSFIKLTEENTATIVCHIPSFLELYQDAYNFFVRFTIAFLS